MARDGSGSQFYATPTATALPSQSVNPAWSAHAFVQSSAVPSGVGRMLLNMRGSLGFSNAPDHGLRWDHSSSTFRQAAQNRGSGGYSAAKASATLSVNTWYSFGGSFDGSTLRFYLNGVADGTAAATAGNDIAVPYVSLFGSLNSATTLEGDQFSDGMIAEAAVWSEALSADNFAALAKGFRARAVRPQNLLFYAPMVRDENEMIRGPLFKSGSGAAQPHPRVFG